MRQNNLFFALIIICICLSACNPANPGSIPPVIPSPVVTQMPEVTPPRSATQVIERSNWKSGSTSIGKGVVLSGEFSLDGKRFATVTPLGIDIYAVDTLQQLDSIPADPPVLAAAFSPDWSSIATGRGSTVTIRRLDDKQVTARLETEPGIAYHLLFSPDGSLLASFVKPPGDEIYHFIVELWNVRDGKRLSEWQVSLYDNTFFTPDGKTFIAWDESRQAGVRRWEIPSGTALPAWTNLDPYPLAFSPDGKLYAASIDSTFLVQSVANKAQVFKGTTSSSATIKLLRFSPDSSLLLCWFIDGALQVWRIADGKLLSTIQTGPPTVRFLAISPDDKALAIPTFDGIAFYSFEDGALLRRLKNHIDAIDQAVISPLGDKAAALVEGDALMVWSLPDGNLLYSLSKIGAIGLAWSPDGQSLVLGDWDGGLRILRAENGSLIRSIPAHMEQVQSIAFSSDGTLLASSSMESVKLWNFTDGALLQNFTVPGGWVPKVKFSRDGQYLAASSAEGKVVIWQSRSGQMVAEIPVPELSGDRDVIDFAPDGSYLAIGEMSQIGLWHIHESKPFLFLPVGNEKIITLQISPDGNLLVCGLTDGSVQFWQIPQGKLVQTIQGGAEGIASLDFSADGRILLSASRDGTLHTWSVGK